MFSLPRRVCLRRVSDAADLFSFCIYNFHSRVAAIGRAPQTDLLHSGNRLAYLPAGSGGDSDLI